MKINDQIVKAYLENGNINEFRNAWYFTSSTVAGNYGNNIFNEPIAIKIKNQEKELMINR